MNYCNYNCFFHVQCRRSGKEAETKGDRVKTANGARFTEDVQRKKAHHKAVIWQQKHFTNPLMPLLTSNPLQLWLIPCKTGMSPLSPMHPYPSTQTEEKKACLITTRDIFHMCTHLNGQEKEAVLRKKAHQRLWYEGNISPTLWCYF